MLCCLYITFNRLICGNREHWFWWDWVGRLCSLWYMIKWAMIMNWSSNSWQAHQQLEQYDEQENLHKERTTPKKTDSMVIFYMITYLVVKFLALMYYRNIITYILVPMWMAVGQNCMPFIKIIHITVISNKHVHGPSPTSFQKILVTV